MFTSTDLKATITLIRPIVARQLDDAEMIAGHREKVTAQGGDWSQVKALVKAMIQDERDEAGGHKRVMAILHKADNALGYADMLGLGNLNENNSFADDPPHDEDGVIIENNEPASVPPTSAAVVEAQPLDNAEEGGVRQPSSAPNSVAPTLAADTEGFNPALIAEELSPSSSAPNSQPVDEHDARDDRSPVAADAHATDKTGDRANGGGSDEAVTARPNSTQQAGAGEGETSSAPGHSNIIPITRKDDGRPRSSEGLPRPYGCKNVDACATTWRAEQPCTLCRAEIAIEVGGVSIPHHGEVA